MTLLDDIAAEVQHPGGNCTIGAILNRRDDIAADLAIALADTARYPHSAIARALTARGDKMAAVTVGRHRRGECTCPS